MGKRVLSRLLLALLVKSTLPRGESKNGLKCTPNVGHARSAKILRQKRVIRNYLAASWSSAVGDDALGVPRCGSDICLMASEILRCEVILLAAVIFCSAKLYLPESEYSCFPLRGRFPRWNGENVSKRQKGHAPWGEWLEERSDFETIEVVKVENKTKSFSAITIKRLRVYHFRIGLQSLFLKLL